MGIWFPQRPNTIKYVQISSNIFRYSELIQKVKIIIFYIFHKMTNQVEIFEPTGNFSESFLYLLASPLSSICVEGNHLQKVSKVSSDVCLWKEIIYWLKLFLVFLCLPGKWSHHPNYVVRIKLDEDGDFKGQNESRFLWRKKLHSRLILINFGQLELAAVVQ